MYLYENHCAILFFIILTYFMYFWNKFCILNLYFVVVIFICVDFIFIFRTIFHRLYIVCFVFWTIWGECDVRLENVQSDIIESTNGPIKYVCEWISYWSYITVCDISVNKLIKFRHLVHTETWSVNGARVFTLSSTNVFHSGSRWQTTATNVVGVIVIWICEQNSLAVVFAECSFALLFVVRLLFSCSTEPASGIGAPTNVHVQQKPTTITFNAFGIPTEHCTQCGQLLMLYMPDLRQSKKCPYTESKLFIWKIISACPPGNQTTMPT